jgi:hypothetical protein
MTRGRTRVVPSTKSFSTSYENKIQASREEMNAGKLTTIPTSGMANKGENV